MEKWLRISLLLCTFGFFREMRPSEPFVADFLVGEWHNLTTDQVNKQIYPFGTYAYLAELVLIFLLTDMLRYKPFIVLSAIAGIVLFCVLTWTTKIWELQVGQLFYGFFMASEVAYYTYIYAKVEKEHFQMVTGHTRSAILCGKFIGAVLAQVLISTQAMNFQELHYISIGSQVISLFTAFALPPVRESVYFYSTNKSIVANSEEGKSNTMLSQNIEFINMEKSDPKQTVSTLTVNTTASNEASFSWSNATRLLVDHTVSAYSQPIVVKWSIWWALATCGQLLVYSYIQLLWKEIHPNSASTMNGAVEATLTLLGALGALSAGFMNSNRHKQWHFWILTIGSLLMGASLIVSSLTYYIWVSYAMYIFCGTIYYFVITIATATVAEHLIADSFGLIFGINTLIALILQTIMTLIVVTDKVGFALDARGQFMVFGCYFIVLAVLYYVVAIIRFICEKLSCCRQQKTLTIQNIN